MKSRRRIGCLPYLPANHKPHPGLPIAMVMPVQRRCHQTSSDPASDVVAQPLILGVRALSARLSGVIRREPESAPSAIAIDGVWRAEGVGEREVGIGPHEIEGIACEACGFMLRRPAGIRSC
jgi:hypothetical protein